MSGQQLVIADNVSKKYCRTLKRSLWYGLQDISHEIIGKSGRHDRLRKDEFFAVTDVAFELERGECLGLIGANGSGKSTLLKMLNGLLKPDRGTIKVRGKVGALIELGAGFNPILTGRENIYINASVLGLSKKEIDNKLDAIIDFAEIEEFIDAPVKNYSSGMKVRLGFAIAAQLEPDVLLVDEVLAVGDVGFRAKCFNHIYNILDHTAVILVSHSMQQITRICTHALLLHHGETRYQGEEVGEAVARYYKLSSLEQPQFEFGGEKAQIHKVEIESNGVVNPDVITYRDPVTIHVYASIDKDISDASVGFVITSEELTGVMSCLSSLDGFNVQNPGRKIKISADLGSIYLNPGIYWLRIGIQSGNFGEILVRKDNVAKLTVKGPLMQWAPIQWQAQWSSQSCS